MSVRQLARWFGMNRDKMATVLAEMSGVEPCGNRWQVPLRRMPPEYLLSIGVITPQTFDLSAIQSHSGQQSSIATDAPSGKSPACT